MTNTRLTRDLDEAFLGGVLAGVASRYEWDVTLVRVVAVLLGLATGVVPAVILYLVAWTIMPRSDEFPPAAAPVPGEAAEASETTEAPAADPAPGDAAHTEHPQPGSPAVIANEVAEVLRDAADRLGEAATIAAGAARQAADQIGEVARRPRAVAVGDPSATEVEDAPTEQPGEEESK